MPDGASDVIWRRGHGTVHARDIDRAFDLDGELPPGTLARVRRFRRFLSLLDAGRDDPSPGWPSTPATPTRLTSRGRVAAWPG
jgi:hypothetical protein